MNLSPTLPSYNGTFKFVSICVFMSVKLHRHAYVEVRGKLGKWVLRIEVVLKLVGQHLNPLPGPTTEGHVVAVAFVFVF